LNSRAAPANTPPPQSAFLVRALAGKAERTHIPAKDRQPVRQQRIEREHHQRIVGSPQLLDQSDGVDHEVGPHLVKDTDQSVLIGDIDAGD